MKAIVRIHTNNLTLDVEAVELYIQKELWYDEYCDYEWDLDCVYNTVEEALHAAHVEGATSINDIQIEMVGQKKPDQEVFASYDELYDHEC